MSILLKKLEILSLDERVKQFRSLSIILDIDDLYNNYTKEVQDILVDDECSEKFIKVILNYLYKTEDNNIRIVFKLQCACNIFGVISKNCRAVTRTQIKFWVREIDDINGDDKKQDCYDVLDDFDSSRSSISINNRLMELLGWEDYNTFSIMRGIIEGRIRQSNIAERIIKKVLDMVDRKESSLELVRKEIRRIAREEL